jgi:hypothetical protein
MFASTVFRLEASIRYCGSAARLTPGNFFRVASPFPGSGSGSGAGSCRWLLGFGVGDLYLWSAPPPPLGASSFGATPSVSSPPVDSPRAFSSAYLLANVLAEPNSCCMVMNSEPIGTLKVDVLECPSLW